jgi:WD40 repeat protein
MITRSGCGTCRRASASSDDRTIRVWDIATGTEIQYYAVEINRYTNIQFSEDGRNILIDNDVLSISTLESVIQNPEQRYSSLGVRNKWITLSEGRVLWLSPKYRPGEWVRRNSMLITRSGTSRVTFVSRAEHSLI